MHDNKVVRPIKHSKKYKINQNIKFPQNCENDVTQTAAVILEI